MADYLAALAVYQELLKVASRFLDFGKFVKPCEQRIVLLLTEKRKSYFILVYQSLHVWQSLLIIA